MSDTINPDSPRAVALSKALEHSRAAEKQPEASKVVEAYLIDASVQPST